MHNCITASLRRLRRCRRKTDVTECGKYRWKLFRGISFVISRRISHGNISSGIYFTIILHFADLPLPSAAFTVTAALPFLLATTFPFLTTATFLLFVFQVNFLFDALDGLTAAFNLKDCPFLNLSADLFSDSFFTFCSFWTVIVFSSAFSWHPSK